MVGEGIKQYVKIKAGQIVNISKDSYIPKKETKLHVYNAAKDPKELPITKDSTALKQNASESAQEPGAQELSKDHNVTRKYMTVKEKIQTITNSDNAIPDIEFSDKDKEILRRLELEHEKNVKKQTASSIKVQEKEYTNMQTGFKKRPKTKLSVKPKQSVSKILFIIHLHLFILDLYYQLSPTAKERKVPATRLQRMVSFGTLGIGLGFGTITEYTRRMLGMKKQSIGDTIDSMFLTKANAERIVTTLCKVRGKDDEIRGYNSAFILYIFLIHLVLRKPYRCCFKDWPIIEHTG